MQWLALLPAMPELRAHPTYYLIDSHPFTRIDSLLAQPL